MMPTRVALFPYDDELKEDRRFLDDLMLVASALQTQVTRDVGPIWGVSAVISAFSSLDRIPRGYLPFGITSTLPLNRKGFHFTPDGRPMALVEHRGDWSTSVSHELIEMLIDPTGMNTKLAPSIADIKLDAVEDSAKVVKNVRAYKRQELVIYLVEACDPCEQSTYTIGTVNVSDFVTPEFYDSEPGPAYTRYSFTGRITRPLGLLPGGLITWRTDEPRPAVFQAAAHGRGTRPTPPAELEITRVAPAPDRLSRAWIDAHPQGRQAAKAAARKKDDRPQPRSYLDTSRAARDYAAGVRTQVQNALDASGPSQSLEQLLTLVRKLARDDRFRERFRRDPAGAIASLGIPVPPGLPPRGQPLDVPLQPAAHYQRLQYLLEGEYRIGYSFTEPDALLWAARFPGR